MANATGAFGLRPSRYMSGAAWTGAVTKCYISANYGTALFVGDPVIFPTAAADKDPTGKHPSIIVSAGTDGILIRGVIVGFEPDPTGLETLYSPASTAGYAYVCMDQNVIFDVRGDGGGTPTKVFPGQNAILIATSSGSTTTGLSGFHLDEGTGTAPTTTVTLPLHILALKNADDNELGDNAIYEVLLNTAELAAGRFLGITAS